MQHLKPENLNKPEYFHSWDLLNLSQYAQIKRLYYISSIKKSPILGKMRKSELKSLNFTNFSQQKAPKSLLFLTLNCAEFGIGLNRPNH